jgi:Motility quorum-sensing regulator, toxin of MqsA
MEKRKLTYDLAAFEAAFDDVDKLNVTGTAVRTAAALGFGRAEIVATIQTMRRAHFYKSMTSYGESSDLAGCVSRTVGSWHAVRQIHSRCCYRVFVAVVQGKG